MNCKEMEANLMSYIAGRAGEAERAAVESHMEACAACRARVAEFRGVWATLDEAPVPEPSPSFDARLRQRIAAEPGRSWFGWLMPAPRLVLATVALLLLMVWVGTRTTAPEQPAPQTDVVINAGDLEDYDVLADFEVLSAIPPAPADDNKL